MKNRILERALEWKREICNKSNIAVIAGVILGSIHAFIFTITAIGYWQCPRWDGQRCFFWIPFWLIDLPITPIYFVATVNLVSLNELSENPILHELYDPSYWIFGPLGTAMWFFLPRLVLSKKYGGVWGKNIHTKNALP